MWLKAELHSHALDDPVDGGKIVRHSACQLIDAASDKSFQILSITNHNQMLQSDDLQRYAWERGILLIPGVEATLSGKHVLLYNFLNYDRSWKSPEVVLQNKGRNQLVVAPHPFFPSPTSLGSSLIHWVHLFDAVEYNHFYLSWANFNRRAVATAHRHNLPMVGNSDVHFLFQLGRTYSWIYAELEVGSVIEAVKQGKIRLITRPVSPLFVAHWLLRTMAHQSGHSLRSALSMFLSQT